MDRTIVENADRWRLPLRGSRVTVVDWADRCATLEFDNGMELAVGYAAQLSPVFRNAGDYARKPLSTWSPTQAEQGLRSSDVVSSVAFRAGRLRIAFRTGWTLRADAADPTFPARIRVGGQTLWDAEGAHTVAGFAIELQILPPPPLVWPNSDDINDIPWPDQ